MYIQIFLIILLLFQYYSCFGECPNNINNINFFYPNNISSCTELTGYILNWGWSIRSLCINNKEFSIKCCITCRNFNDISFQECVDTITCNPRDCNTNSIKSCQRTCKQCNITTPNCLTCNNNGYCSNEYNYYDITIKRCVCTNSKYIGYNCSRINICQTQDNPCKNNAICIGSYEEDIIYTCDCKPGWFGKNCDYCNNNFVCLNGGSCNKDGKCDCLSSFTGTNCAIKNNNCAAIKCLNNGTCNELTAKCTCLNGYSGFTCENTQNKSLICVNKTCLNDGSCNPDTGECKCKTGFNGDDCSNNGPLIAMIVVPIIIFILIVFMLVFLVIYFGIKRNLIKLKLPKNKSKKKRNEKSTSAKIDSITSKNYSDVYTGIENEKNNELELKNSNLSSIKNNNKLINYENEIIDNESIEIEEKIHEIYNHIHQKVQNNKPVEEENDYA